MGQYFGGALVLGLGVLFILALVKSCTRKTTGWIITAVISGIFCCVLVVSGVVVAIGAFTHARSNQDTQTWCMTSDDDTMSLDLPQSWKPHKGLHKLSILSASNLLSEQYVIVIRESRQDYVGSIDDYAKTISKSMSAKIKDSSASEFKELVIHSHAARQCTRHGVVNNVSVAYLLTCIETEDSFYQVLTWTVASQEKHNRPVFEEVALSFKTKGHAVIDKEDDDDTAEDSKSWKK